MSVYKHYLERHEHLSRVLAACLHGLDLAETAIKDYSDLTPLHEVLETSSLRSGFSLWSYRRPGTSGPEAEPARVGDFRSDIEPATLALCRLVVIETLSAFEEAIEQYGGMVVRSQSSTSGWTPAINKLNGFCRDPHKSPRLSHLCDADSRLKPALERLPPFYVRNHRGDERLVRMPGSIHSYNVADMWKKVRNLLVHHGGLVDDEFLHDYDYASIWTQVDQASRSGFDSTPTSAAAGLTLRDPLQLTPGHAIYCLMSCQHVVRTLSRLLQPSDMQQRLKKPDKMTVSKLIGQVEYGTRALGDRRNEQAQALKTWEDGLFIEKFADAGKEAWDRLQKLLYHSSWLDTESGELVASWAARLMERLPTPVDALPLGLLLTNSRGASPNYARQIVAHLLRLSPSELIDGDSDSEALAHFVLHAWRCDASCAAEWVERHADFWWGRIGAGDTESTGHLLKALTVVNPSLVRNFVADQRKDIISKISSSPNASGLTLCGVLALHGFSPWDAFKQQSVITGQGIANRFTRAEDFVIACWALQELSSSDLDLVHEALSARTVGGGDWRLAPTLWRFPAPWTAAEVQEMLRTWADQPFNMVEYGVLAVALVLSAYPDRKCNLSSLYETVHAKSLAKAETSALALRLVNTAIHRGTIAFDPGTAKTGREGRTVLAPEDVARTRSSFLDSLDTATRAVAPDSLQPWEFNELARTEESLSSREVDTYRALLLETGAIRWSVVRSQDGKILPRFSPSE